MPRKLVWLEITKQGVYKVGAKGGGMVVMIGFFPNVQKGESSGKLQVED